MKERDPFDFWYAVNNTEIVLLPSRHLETFGTTILHYHLVSELMDSVSKVRIREGRIQANQPQIITPQAYANLATEGFGEEAEKYLDWLREHEKDVRILQYGYRLRQESFSEHVVTDTVESVVQRVKQEVETANDPLGAVVLGVDNPWDVCLIKLFWEMIQHSAGTNIQEMAKKNLFEYRNGAPHAVHQELEADFLAASKDASLIAKLGKKLQNYGLFGEYEDRFFSLVKASKRK